MPGIMPYILGQAFCVMYPWIPTVAEKLVNFLELAMGHEREFYFVIENGWLCIR